MTLCLYRINNKQFYDMSLFHDLVRWYFSRRTLPYWALLLLDSFFVAFSLVFVVALDEGTVNAVTGWRGVALGVAVLLPCYIAGFRLFHTYAGIVRYSTLIDLHRVGLAALSGLALSQLARLVLSVCGVELVVGYLGLVLVFMLSTLLISYFLALKGTLQVL